MVVGVEKSLVDAHVANAKIEKLEQQGLHHC